MAFAETAALISSLELQDKFSKTVGKYEKALGGMERKTSTFGKITDQTAKGIGTAWTNLGKIALVGVGFLGANVAAGVASIVKLEEVTAATNAVIESTGGVAGISAAKVRELAESYESLNAMMDDKVIQSAENVLLTFTAIGEEAFPLALEAALNMNQALGGGEEGLQGTIIQVGKALQDPIRGITALRRVGVNFTEAQRRQIATLVEQNRLFEAQQLILQELGTEFGGQFAAAGDTAAARFAKFKDAIEDAQMALAGAFLPVLEKVGDKLTDFLSDPATIRGLEELGANLADAFDSIIELAGNLPWTAIGDAFRLMGTGSKALLDAFTKLPPWVQTAVLTGWGLNKLTGGALTSIAGALASGLIKGILGINAAVVNITAGTVTGGGGGAPVVLPPTNLRTALPTVGQMIAALTAVGIFTVIGTTIGDIVAQNVTRPLDPVKFDFNTIAGQSGNFSTAAQAEQFAQALADELGIPLADVKQGILDGVLANGLTFDAAVRRLEVLNEGINLKLTGSRTQATRDAKQTQQQLDNLKGVAEQTRREAGAGFTSVAAAQARAKEQASADAVKALQAQSAAQVKLQQIADKDFRPTITVGVTSNVSITDITRRLMQQHMSITAGSIGGT